MRNIFYAAFLDKIMWITRIEFHRGYPSSSNCRILSGSPLTLCTSEQKKQNLNFYDFCLTILIVPNVVGLASVVRLVHMLTRQCGYLR
jgi:hypothetical protein